MTRRTKWEIETYQLWRVASVSQGSKGVVWGDREGCCRCPGRRLLTWACIALSHRLIDRRDWRWRETDSSEVGYGVAGRKRQPLSFSPVHRAPSIVLRLNKSQRGAISSHEMNLDIHQPHKVLYTYKIQISVLLDQILEIICRLSYFIIRVICSVILEWILGNISSSYNQKYEFLSPRQGGGEKQICIHENTLGGVFIQKWLRKLCIFLVEEKRNCSFSNAPALYRFYFYTSFHHSGLQGINSHSINHKWDSWLLPALPMLFSKMPRGPAFKSPCNWNDACATKSLERPWVIVTIIGSSVPIALNRRLMCAVRNFRRYTSVLATAN